MYIELFGSGLDHFQERFGPQASSFRFLDRSCCCSAPGAIWPLSL